MNQPPLLPPELAEFTEVLLEELIKLNETDATKALFKELTRRSKRITAIYEEELTDESYAAALSEQHLIDTFKLYHRITEAKIKLFQKNYLKARKFAVEQYWKNEQMVAALREQSARDYARYKEYLSENNITITYDDLKWQSSIIKRLRAMGGQGS